MQPGQAKPISEHEFNTVAGKFSLNLDVPESFTLGLAFKPGAGWLFEVDMRWIEFSDTLNSIPIDGPATPGVPPALTPGWDNQLVYMLGLQKDLNAETSIRAGLNYGASPIEANDVDNNLGSIAITELHLSFGASHRFNKNIMTSFSFTHAFKNDLTSSSPSGNNVEVEQNILYLQITYTD